MRGTSEFALIAALLFFGAGVPGSASSQGAISRLVLSDGWALQSSCKISASGAEISSPGFATAGWHRVSVPSTVLAALVADDTYPDPYSGDNLRSIPGEAYSTDNNFVLQDMPADSPFRCSWWYRLEFTPPLAKNGGYATLHFDGINNRANIWLNGKKIADAADVAGADRTYDFDTAGGIEFGGPNVLAVEVFAPTPQDFGINWVDWNPAPPDKDMGLWRTVYIDCGGAVAIRHPYVATHFPSASLDVAELTVGTELHNSSAQSVSGLLTGDIEGVSFRQKVTLAAHESRSVHFAPEPFTQLRLHHPKLWWPAQMGEPALQELHLRFTVDGVPSDEQAVRFGIREITSSLDEHGHRLFRINGKRILIRGGGWAPDMLLRESPQRVRTEFRYIRDLNLNTLRLEGKLESEEFYDLADQKGVLIMPGWSCCDLWQDGPKWTPAQLQIATESLRSQILRLRNHPSVLVWLNGSDEGPPPNVESAYIGVLKDGDWSNPVLFSAAEEPSEITGVTGVKMTGPYDYVPPDFWLTDDGGNGGAAGFNTETSPGAAIPPRNSLEKMLGAGHIQLGDPAWAFHTAQGTFSKLDHFNESMNAVYGAPSDLDDYERKAQTMAYDSERAMFEAYSRRKYTATTGIIQWMLNNAWPSAFWHLYDYYLQPAGGYFGAKKALEPLHVMYSYDDRSVAVLNSTYVEAAGLKVAASVYDAALKQVFSWSGRIDLKPDSATRATVIPESALSNDSPVHYVRLTLTKPDGGVASTNFYWLSSKRNVFDWSKASFRYTPVSNYEDLKALLALQIVHLRATYGAKSGPEGPLVTVQLSNPSSDLAFQIAVGVRRQSEDSQVLPVLWSDNYFELLPGESREITAHYLSPDTLKAPSEIVVTGWNISQLTIPIRRSQ
jgi:exo-1,4-beta-D-glucosaminidase